MKLKIQFLTVMACWFMCTPVFADYFKIFKDKNFEGNSSINGLTGIVDGQLYQITGPLHDNMSSIIWDLTGNRKITFYEHSNGTGRQYVITGSGADPDTHNEDFKDCASSWRLEEGGPTIPLAFSDIPKDPTALTFERNGHEFPSGGHMQGIQQLGSRHLVISSSSDKLAYFFIVEWSGAGIQSTEVGKVIDIVIINDDFPEIDDNHAGGIQLVGSILAIGTEKGKDEGSSVVFYDLSDINNPVPVGKRIERDKKTAGAVAIIQQDSNYLLAVGGWHSADVDFYTSNNLNLSSTSCEFTIQKKWTKDDINTTGWIDGNWGCYEGLNLMQEPNGQVYLVGFHRSSNKDWADLYSVDMGTNTPTSKMLKKIDKKHVVCSNGTSFRYSGGLYVRNPAENIRLWATERTVKDKETNLNHFDF